MPTSPIKKVATPPLKLHKHCNICSSIIEQNNTVVLASGSISHKDHAITLHTIMCRNCSFIFQLEIYDDALNKTINTIDTGNNFSNDINYNAQLKKNLLKRQQFISKAIKHNKGEKFSLLDVGGGTGECTAHLAAEGDIYVIDYNDDMPVNINNKLIKFNGDFMDYPFEISFDYIIMNHVLEHAPYPLQFISKAYSLLNEGGLLIVEVPFELYTPLLFKKIGDLHHVCYFNASSLKTIVSMSGLTTRELNITTGNYGRRTLAVIRCVARKEPGTSYDSCQKGTALDIITDCLHPIAFYHGIIRRIIAG